MPLTHPMTSSTPFHESLKVKFWVECRSSKVFVAYHLTRNPIMAPLGGAAVMVAMAIRITMLHFIRQILRVKCVLV